MADDEDITTFTLYTVCLRIALDNSYENDPPAVWDWDTLCDLMPGSVQVV